MNARRILTSDEWVKLVLGFSLLFGGIVRVFPGLMAGFPLNDGGMFLVMIRELRAGNFGLPAFTAYNAADIPFAYPPFGLYAAAALSAAGVPEFSILQWLPVVINFASIPAFFLLASALLQDRPRAALATIFFALTAGSYSWQIMGGGVTRSFGMLFMILTVWSVHRMFRSSTWKAVALSILLCALAVLSHPEVSLAVAVNCALVWTFFGRNKSGTLHAGAVAAGTAFVSAIWWGTVLAQHRSAPFLSVFHSGAYVDPPLVGLASGLFAPGALFTPAGILRIAGLIWCIKERQFFLPVWLALPFFVEPRSALAMSFLPSCLLIAIGLMNVLPYVVDRLAARGPTAPRVADATQRPWLTLTAIGLALVLFIQSALFDFRLVNTTLIPPHPQAALHWARTQTPPGSRFLVLTGFPGIMSDPYQEWFPALAERRSQTTLQGLEWTLGPDFFPRLSELVELQGCESVACVEAWSARTGLDYDHVLIPKSETARALLEAFGSHDAYESVYENPEVAIFEK